MRCGKRVGAWVQGLSNSAGTKRVESTLADNPITYAVLLGMLHEFGPFLVLQALGLSTSIIDMSRRRIVDMIL